MRSMWHVSAMTVWTRAMDVEHDGDAAAPYVCSRAAVVHGELDSKLIFLLARTVDAVGGRSPWGVPPQN